MMTFVTRFGPALCIALMLQLLLAPVRAAGDSQAPTDGFGPPAQDTRLTHGSEIITFNIAVPKPCGAFETSASLLILQPSAGNLMYGTLVNPFPFFSPHWANQSVRPDFTPAFNVGVRYLFDCGGDIQLDWTHFNSYDTGSARAAVPLQLGQMSGPPDVQALGPPYLIGPPVPYATAIGVAHFDYDSVDLGAGLRFAIGNRVQLRPYTGIQVARISESLTGTFRSADGTLGLIDVSQSSFTGAGPRLGMELHFLAGNFDLLGGIAGSILIGTRQCHMDFTAIAPPDPNSTTPPPPVPNIQSLTSPSVTQAIPCIDAKLATSYARPFGNFGIWKCELGYQATVYINVINQYALTEVENTLVADKPGAPETTGLAVFLRTAAETQTNFIVHGPYVKFSLQF
jgi:hypothetical protein